MGKRNPVAKALRSPALRPRVVVSKRRVMRERLAKREAKMKY